MSRNLLCLALCASGIACSNLHSGPITVLVHPGTASVQVGETEEFVAEVQGSFNPNVVWSVQEVSGGSITQLGVYTAPSAAGTYHVVATADADHATYGVAVVTVTPAPIVIGVAVSPASASLTEGAAQQFTAAVTNTQIAGVIWSVVEGNGGSIGTDGTYIAPANEGVFHVTATSIADRTSSGTAEVVVTAPDGGAFVNIAPATTVSAHSLATAFAATVSGEASQAVAWSIEEGADGGTIDADGNYTAPAADGVFHIHATSAADPSAVGTAVVTVTEESVAISPQSVMLDPGGTQQFTASIEDNPSGQGAIFTVASGGGSISASGLYTAPQTAGAYSVVASTPDGLFTASATVIVSPKISGTISYAGAKTGRVYVEAYQQLVGSGSSTPLGSVSLAAPGAYAISGVPLQGGSSTVTVIAWMDTTGASPEPLATDPLGDVVQSITGAASGTSIAGVNVALADPAGLVPDAPDAAPEAFPGDGAALVSWDPVLNSAGDPEADHYRLFAIPVPAGENVCTSNLGATELDVPAYAPTYAVITGLANFGSYCFAYCASASGTDGPLSSFTAPITIGTPTTGVTASGSVSYSGFTASGALLVIARDDAGDLAAFTRIAPVGPSPQSFTLSGVATGSYHLTAIFDQGSDGYASPTDPTNANDVIPTLLTVAGAAQSGLTLDVAPPDAQVQATTDHFLDDTAAGSESNSVDATIDPGLKLPVAVQLVSGTDTIPSDLPLADYASDGPAEWFFLSESSGAPGPGGSYQFSVTFSDGTTGSFSASTVYLPVVTNVVPANGSTAASDSPAISWTPPSPLPASYSTQVLVTSTDGEESTIWQSAPLPMGTNTVAYDVDGTGTELFSGTSYFLTVTVTDAFGDTSERSSVFTAP